MSCGRSGLVVGCLVVKVTVASMSPGQRGISPSIGGRSQSASESPVSYLIESFNDVLKELELFDFIPYTLFNNGTFKIYKCYV